MAVCIAILDRNSTPLKLKTNDVSKEVVFHYIVHTSLDVIEEKCLSSTSPSAVKTSDPPRDLYLGILYSTEQYKVFGYVTNTSVKFIIIVEATNTNIRDNEIRQMFRKLHAGYSNMLFNPFYLPGQPIESKKFDAVVKSLLLPVSSAAAK